MAITLFTMARRALTYLVLFMLVILTKNSFSQDPAFSQFYANPLYLNPALAGSAYAPRLILNYRNQWPKLDNNFVTYNASYDQYIPNISSSFGVLFNSDRAGGDLLTTTSFSGIYSYSLPVSRQSYLNFGLQASYFQKKLNWDALQFGDEIDPVRGFVYRSSEPQPANTSLSYVDFSAGMAYSYADLFFAGVAVNHLTQPNESWYGDNTSKLDMKITLHAGGIIDLEQRARGRRATEAATLSPNILYQQQGNFKQLNVGVYFNKYPFVVGGWFRHNIENADAFIFLLGFQYDSFSIGYSYDVTVSKLKDASGGAHELSLRFQFSDYKLFSSRGKNRGPMPCPQF